MGTTPQRTGGRAERGFTRRTRSGAAALTLAAGVIGGVASCGSPLGRSATDYPPGPPVERLRKIERFEPERFVLPTPPPAEEQAPAAGPPDRFAGMERIALSIEECRVETLRNNLELSVALVNPAIAAEGIREEEGRFDAVFRPRLNVIDTDDPTFDVTAGNQREVVSGGAGVSIPLRTGGRATVDFEQRRTRTDSEFFTLREAHSNDLTFSISQPLLRNAGRRVNTAGIAIAALDQDVAEAQTKLEVIRQLAAVDRSYWRLYAVRQELEVRQQQYELAVELLERARRRVRAGDAPEVEVLRAESGVAERLEGIILAENAVLRQQRELKRIINVPGLDIGGAVLVETATPPDPVAYEFDGHALAEAALGPGGRMEMLELELRLAQDAINIEFNRNQALPLLSLDYSYRISGLGDTMRRSADVLTDADFQSWSLGLVGEIPIGNESARARVQRSILVRLQRLNTREARAQSIRREVYDAVDQVTASWQRILAARQSVLAATRTYEAERRQNEVGVRTATDVLDAAARLAEAQSAEIRAVTDYQISLVDLSFATGTMLGAAKVVWTPVPDAPPRREGTREIELRP